MVERRKRKPLARFKINSSHVARAFLHYIRSTMTQSRLHHLPSYPALPQR